MAGTPKAEHAEQVARLAARLEALQAEVETIRCHLREFDDECRALLAELQHLTPRATSSRKPR